MTILVATAIGTTTAQAARKKQQAPQVALTEAGQKLEAQYTGQLEALKAEITKALPAVNEQKKSAFLKAREAEDAAEAAIKSAQQRA